MLKRFAPLALVAVLLAGCATGHPHIADIKYNPGKYQNRSVTVDGVVTSSWGVPLVPFKLYKVDDGTGEVTVVSQDGRAPTKALWPYEKRARVQHRRRRRPEDRS